MHHYDAVPVSLREKIFEKAVRGEVGEEEE
jgi:hypothetical protein